MTSKESQRPPVVSAVVLAAGGSSRMGRAKQLLPLAGRPVLAHAVDAAAGAARVAEVVVVIGSEAGRVREALAGRAAERLKLVMNPDWREGLASSLRCGLHATDPEAEAACVLLGDQPGVTSACIDRVVDEYAESSKPVVRPLYRGEGGTDVPGHPVLISREIWHEIDGLRGDEGLRGWLSRHPDRLGTVALDGPAPADIDDEGDYAAVRRETEH